MRHLKWYEIIRSHQKQNCVQQHKFWSYQIQVLNFGGLNEILGVKIVKKLGNEF
jgi:hypothetical protein